MGMGFRNPGPVAYVISVSFYIIATVRRMRPSLNLNRPEYILGPFRLRIPLDRIHPEHASEEQGQAKKGRIKHASMHRSITTNIFVLHASPSLFLSFLLEQA